MSDSNNPFMRHNGIKFETYSLEQMERNRNWGMTKKNPLETQKGLGDFK
jgi:hypothetical protein